MSEVFLKSMWDLVPTALMREDLFHQLIVNKLQMKFVHSILNFCLVWNHVKQDLCLFIRDSAILHTYLSDW